MGTQEVNLDNKVNIFATNYFNIFVLILSVFFLVINHDVLRDLYHKWYAQELTGAYSHGLLVAVIVLYLLYKKIQNIKSYLKIKPSVIGFIILLGSQALLLASDISGINFLQHILLVVSLLALVWSLYSYRVAKEFFLPAVLFSLTFPVWGDAELPLQKISVFLTNLLLSVTGLPYYHEQAFFHFPNGIIEIAPECAGLQQLLVSLIIGLLFSAQRNLRILDTIKTLIYISLASVLINSIRILIIMFVGYFTKMESSLISQHVILGWIVFGIGIYVFLFFYSRRKFKSAPDAGTLDPGMHAARLTNVQRYTYLTALVIVILLPSLLMASVTSKINNRDVTPVSYTITLDEWKKASDTLNINWKPEYPPGDSLAVGEYVKQNRTIYVYVSKYARLKEDVEPVNMENKPYDHNNWSQYAREAIRVRNPEGHLDKVLLDRLTSKSNEHLEVLTYYLINGHVADTLIKAKLLTLLGFLKLKYDIKVVCLAIKSDSENTGSQAALIDLYKNLTIY